jgi:hypothetical protein
MSVPRDRWAVIAVTSAVLAGALEVAGVHSPLRVAVMLWFVLACPGMAIVRLLRMADVAAAVTLAVAVSITLATAVAALGLYSGLWAPGATLAVLIAITIGAAAVRGPRPGERL